MAEKSIGILVCAILFTIGGMLGILGGVIIFLVEDLVSEDLVSDLIREAHKVHDLKDVDPSIVKTFATTFVKILALILILLGSLSLVVAYGLWKTKKWARIAGIILAIIGGISWFPIGTVMAIIIVYLLLTG